MNDTFCGIAKYFSDHQLEYCVLGNTNDFPQKSVGDVDVCINLVRSNSAFHKLVVSLARQKGMVVLQHIQHESLANYYVLLLREGGRNDTLIKLDLCVDYMRNGRSLLSATEILANRRKARDHSGADKCLYIAAPETEFTYYLLKKIDKNELSERHCAHLSDVWRQAPDAALESIGRFWGSREKKHFAEAAESGDWKWVQDNIHLLRKTLHRKIPRLSLVSWFAESQRVLQRIMNPTGISVVFLGPDGCGKSSVLDMVMAGMEPVYSRKANYHLFPADSRARKHQATEPDPHGQKQRDAILSIGKLALWLYRYRVGWLCNVLPKKIRSTAIYFDRYYQDLLVDPARYRYGGPMWLARLVGRLIPRPDLWFVLDAPPEVFQDRKQEVPFEETARQRQAYLKLSVKLKECVVIDASQSIDKVVDDVRSAIFEFMAKRENTRLSRYVD